MRILAGLIISTALGGAAIAAEPARMSDTTFLEAARCAGLASSSALGSPDGAALKAVVKNQGWSRDPYILDKADEAQFKAKRDADHADTDARAKLTAELKGVCATLMG